MSKKVFLILIITIFIGQFFVGLNVLAESCKCNYTYRIFNDMGSSYINPASEEKNCNECTPTSCGKSSKNTIYSSCTKVEPKTTTEEPETPQITEITLNVPIPGTKSTMPIGEALGLYISAWYSFIIGSVGVLATVMIMIAGFKWLTSAGDSSKIGDAKDMIFAAIIGLVLAFLSYTILYLVNPNLTMIHLPDLTTRGVQLASSYTSNGVPITDIGFGLADRGGGLQTQGEGAGDALARNAKAAANIDTSRVPGTEEGNLACAYVVNEIARNTFGESIGGNLSTQEMNNSLLTNSNYKRTSNAHNNLNDLQLGDIIMSPTGDDRLSREHGHVGIYIGNGQITSNIASAGRVGTPYDVNQWTQRYGFFDTYRHN